MTSCPCRSLEVNNLHIARDTPGKHDASILPALTRNSLDTLKNERELKKERLKAGWAFEKYLEKYQ